MVHTEVESLIKDPWRCSHCGLLIYNIDPEGYPVAGSPLGLFINIQYPRVCHLCYYMVTNDQIGTDYWRTIHAEWRKEQERRRKKNDGLSGKTDYFSGDTK